MPEPVRGAAVSRAESRYEPHGALLGRDCVQQPSACAAFGRKFCGLVEVLALSGLIQRYPR